MYYCSDSMKVWGCLNSISLQPTKLYSHVLRGLCFTNNSSLLSSSLIILLSTYRKQGLDVGVGISDGGQVNEVTMQLCLTTEKINTMSLSMHDRKTTQWKTFKKTWRKEWSSDDSQSHSFHFSVTVIRHCHVQMWVCADQNYSADIKGQRVSEPHATLQVCQFCGI